MRSFCAARYQLTHVPVPVRGPGVGNHQRYKASYLYIDVFPHFSDSLIPWRLKIRSALIVRLLVNYLIKYLVFPWGAGLDSLI